MSHGLGWKDDEIVQLASCNGERVIGLFTINIYDWTLCPKCGKELKLVQRNDVLEREAAENA